MFVTQFYGANASGFYGAGLAGTDPAAIKLLQQTLKNAGKSGGNVSNPNGVMDGYTLAAAYEILRDRGGTTAQLLATMANQGAGDAVGQAFQALRDLDSKLSQVPGISLSIPALLRDSTKVSQVVSVAQAAIAIACNGLGSVCSTASDVVNKLQSGLNTFFSTMSGAAPALLKVMKVLGLPVPATTTTTTTISPSKLSILSALRPIKQVTATQLPSPTTPTTPAYPAGTVYAFSSKLGKYRIAVPKTAGFAGFGIADSGGDCMFGDCGLGATATFTEVAPSATPPAGGTAVTETDLEKKTGTLPFYKKPLFWAAVGGGVVVVGGGSYWLIRRRKRSV